MSLRCQGSLGGGCAVAVAALLCLLGSEALALDVIALNPHAGHDQADRGRIFGFLQDRVRESNRVVILDARSAEPLASIIDLSLSERREIADRLSGFAASWYADSQDEIGTDLTATLDIVHDTIRAFGVSEPGEPIDFHLIDAHIHKHGDVDFSVGYPNDGFLFLKDNGFAHLAKPTPDASDKRLHIYFTEPIDDYGEEQQRFYAHFAERYLGAELASFNRDLNVGRLPPMDETPIDQTIARSLVVFEASPDCATVDRVNWRQLPGGRLAVKIANRCRAASRVEIVHNGERVTAIADDEGHVEIAVDAYAGENTIDLVGLNNKLDRVITADLGAFPDALSAELSDGQVTINGENPIRRDDEQVTIRHENGRKWIVTVRDDRFQLKDVDLEPGVNSFTVSGPRGGEDQQIVVENGTGCLHQRQVDQTAGTATITIDDPCLKGRLVDFSYDGRVYTVDFDGEGQGELRLSLVNPINTITYDVRREEQTIEIPFPEFSNIAKITLRWQDNVDLDLHIREGEGGTEVSYRAKRALGELDIDERGRSEGMKEENYRVDAARLDEGVLLARVHFYSRGADSEGGSLNAQFCDEGLHARIPFSIVILDRGERTERDYVFEAADCNAEIDQATDWQDVARINL